MGKDNGPFHTKDEEVEFRRQKFAGSQADRKEREEAETVMVAAQLQKTNVSVGLISALASLLKLRSILMLIHCTWRILMRVKDKPEQWSVDLSNIYLKKKMQNRKQCVLCNLKSANMRGIKAQTTAVAALNSETTPE
ncbi:unnamed protein product [Malus baccata var. baccata]